MKKTLISTAVIAALMSGCGGGGGSDSTASNTNSDGEILSTTTTGYDLPTEISAVPADSSSTATGVRMAGLMSRLIGVGAADLPASSDYVKADAKKYVEERSLEQFSIVEQVLNALAQTHYAEPENINAGPYTAMIAWADEQDGHEVKQLQPWVVDSRMIVVNGQDVNRVLAWIEEPSEVPGETMLIKGEFKIYQSATLNDDGSFADYGIWDLNVAFSDPVNGTVENYFAASSRIDANGVNTVSVHDHQNQSMGGSTSFLNEIKGILVRSGTTGYGKVSFPDFESCFQSQDPSGCTPTNKTAQYAYNADYVVVDSDINTSGTTDAEYKDRDPANAVEFTHRYGLFYAAADSAAGVAAGDNVEKHKSFGFPIRFTDSYGATRHAYYGAWQGRHSLWGGEDLNEGDTVTRDDRGPNQTAETYTVSAPFNGTLTKRTLIDGSLDDIKGINVETWLNKHYDLFYNATQSQWQYCDGWVDFMQPTPTCMNKDGSGATTFTAFTAFGSLVVSGDADRKSVNIGTWDNTAQMEKNYVYLATDPGTGGWAGAGFYQAQRNMQTGQLSANQPLALYTPSDGDNLWVDIGGSIYIQYNGDFSGTTTTTGWIQRKLASFDQTTWTPTFDSSGDQPFSPEMGRDYYINSRGTNYVVKRVNPADADTSYGVQLELQTAANPVNVSTLMPTGAAYLRTPWRSDIRYTFDNDSSSATFLQLVHANDDPNTPDDDTGTLYTSGEWGLQAYSDNGTPNDFTDDQPLMADGTAVTVDQWGIPTDPSQSPVQFNWEYSEGGFGSQRFLMSNGQYVLLDDPIQLQPVTLTNGAGQSKNLALQFDGWMHGLPDLYYELSKNDWQMSQEISDKVINIAAGTEVTDAATGASYYVKPLEMSMFLKNVTESDITTAGGTAPDITDADAVSLSDVPDYTDNGMGDKPTGTEVKYSEGKLVE